MKVQAAPVEPTTSKSYTYEELADLVRKNQSYPVVKAFHQHWYFSGHTWAMSRYCGIPILKAPSDLQVYHDLIWGLRPTTIIETGTCFGGSALWFAHQLALLGGLQRRVISVDIEDFRESRPTGGGEWKTPDHPDISWVCASGGSTDPGIVETVKRLILPDGPVLVSLDSDHSQAHVARELALYAPLVTPGSYVVVEDTNMSGRPIEANDPGPGAAVDAFLDDHPEFIADPTCERYLLTMFPGGWLRRVQ